MKFCLFKTFRYTPGVRAEGATLSGVRAEGATLSGVRSEGAALVNVGGGSPEI